MDLNHTEATYLPIIKNGLPPATGRRKKIIVLGAGVAGLSAAYELLHAGHDPLILEAQGRVGGRIYTLREPFTQGLHAEAGAMRIPRSHRLTLAYIDKFNLPTAPFTMDNPQGYAYIAGHRYRLAEIQRQPALLDFPVAPQEQGKSANQLWNEALAPLLERIQTEGEASWEDILAQYDEYSVREFLEMRGLSEGAIEMIGLLLNQEALMNTAFLEVLREEAGAFYTDMVYLVGGSDNLPRAFLPALRERIHFGTRVIALDQSPDEVIVYYQTGGGRFEARGDYAIITLPFAVMRHIEVLKPFSRSKQRAIRQLHYDASAKVFLQFRRRFWEEEDFIFGGGSVTDLAVRNVYYPDHGRETGRGILLASYTWGEDAQRWGSLPPHERIHQALENIAQIHPAANAHFEVGASQMWHDDPYAGGAFAIFEPGQQSLLYEAMISPEGRYHFAGEHASLYHAWIQGAIESGLRAAMEIHTAP